MKYLLLGLLIFTVFSSTAQIQRAYLTVDGRPTKKLKNASSYVLIDKLEDSSYRVLQYDMHDTILYQGTFKDRFLEIPEGKFFFYYKNRNANNKYLFYDKAPDTNNYVIQVGYFLNGLPTGCWIQYSKRGVISRTLTFENGRLNGSSSFVVNDDLLEANYVNSKREGHWRRIRLPDSLVLAEAYFKNDTLQSDTVYWHPAREQKDLNAFLKNQLKKYKKVLTDNFPIISYTINKKGRIVSPQILKGVSPEIDKAIIDALVDAPVYYPATYNYQPIEQKIKRQLFIGRADNIFEAPGINDVKVYFPPALFVSLYRENDIFYPVTRFRLKE